MEQTAWSGRAYTWSLISYATIEELERLFREAKHWAYCIHDKDVNEESGELKERHIHVLVTFEKHQSFPQICALIDSNQNTLGECRRKCGDKWINLNVQCLYDYLIHYSYTDKYQYDESERVVDDGSYWARYEKGKRPTGDEFLADLLDEYMNERDLLQTMAKKYGRDFIKNYERYVAFRYKLGYRYTESGERITEYEDICYKKAVSEDW